MDKIPSLIKNIVLVGSVNVGKSSLINTLTNQEISIVSNIPGTTTDEIIKRFELLDVGPVNFIDTAGLNDNSILGDKRVERTMKVLSRASIVIKVMDATKPEDIEITTNVPVVKVFNKIDLLDKNVLNQLISKNHGAHFLSTSSLAGIEEFKKYLTTILQDNERRLLDGIEFKFNKIVHVIPIDSEAPKGRLILPQMQLIRECLDRRLISIVLQESELESYLNNNDDIDLIVTDSQVFDYVSKVNGKRFKLTSYSILQANQKGDLQYFINSINDLVNLSSNPHFLIMESCSHNTSHEDIGSVKIPKLLAKIYPNFTYDFKMGNDFPENISKYDYIIHCGSCMLNSDVMIYRIKNAQQHEVPMTNYGIFIAHIAGILNEAVEVFN